MVVCQTVFLYRIVMKNELVQRVSYMKLRKIWKKIIIFQKNCFILSIYLLRGSNFINSQKKKILYNSLSSLFSLLNVATTAVIKLEIVLYLVSYCMEWYFNYSFSMTKLLTKVIRCECLLRNVLERKFSTCTRNKVATNDLTRIVIRSVL